MRSTGYSPPTRLAGPGRRCLGDNQSFQRNGHLGGLLGEAPAGPGVITRSFKAGGFPTDHENPLILPIYVSITNLTTRSIGKTGKIQGLGKRGGGSCRLAGPPLFSETFLPPSQRGCGRLGRPLSACCGSRSLPGKGRAVGRIADPPTASIGIPPPDQPSKMLLLDGRDFGIRRFALCCVRKEPGLISLGPNRDYSPEVLYPCAPIMSSSARA